MTAPPPPESPDSSPPPRVPPPPCATEAARPAPAVPDPPGEGAAERPAPGRRGRRWLLAAALTGTVPLVAIVAAAVAAGSLASGGGQGPVETGGFLQLGATGHFFLAAAAVLAAARAGGALAQRVGQPRVVGEICAGLALGPSLLGRLAPGVMDWLFPSAVLAPIDGLAQFGLVLFMFGVGRELAGMRLRGATGRALLVSQASMAVPFALGALAAVPLAAAFAGPNGSGAAFVLFMGCALSITAFPVLARMLTDLRLLRTEVGGLSLFAAAVGDGASWLVLAAVLAAAAGSAPMVVMVNGVATVLVVALFLGPVKRLLGRWAQRAGGGASESLVLAVGVAAAAALTAALGVHQLIGAMLVGLAWPGTAPGADTGPVGRFIRVADQLTATARNVLLPFFFFGFGLTADLGALDWTGPALPAFLVLLALAVAGKVVGPGVCAWLLGMAPRSALILGALLNARGLTELIVIQIGYDAGIIDAPMAAVLTLVALCTTMMTGPLLRLLRAAPEEEPRAPDRRPAEASR
nr:cation:proton antiporter [Streptomonospora nanhaiensis]